MKKKFISDVHEPFADVQGTKFNYLCEVIHGQCFCVRRGNFEWEFYISKTGKVAKVKKIK